MKSIVRRHPLKLAYDQSRETWQGFDARQKRYAVAASAFTFGRVGLRLALEVAQLRGTVSRRTAAIAHCALDLADNVDGRIARAGNAVTPWGKVADPFADKVDFAVQEYARVLRGELDAPTAGIRTARDVASTSLRSRQSEYAAQHGTQANTAAQWPGKASTAARSVSLRIGDFMPESPIALASQHMATAGLLASLASNAAHYRRASPKQ